MPSERDKTGRYRFSLRALLLVVAAVGILVAVVSSVSRFFDPVPKLEARARKFAPVLDSIYLYRATHGSWPASLEDAIQTDVDSLLSDDSYFVTYRVYDPDDAAEVTVYGPWHSRATYTFCLPGLYTGGWYCSIEGSQQPFNVVYESPVKEADQ
ncbi:MAG TPA: hypothetical protein VMM76_08910 [Pirellulaceae bacterium]|nr:hypothetical protein [Pirellulaceae bacterium]